MPRPPKKTPNSASLKQDELDGSPVAKATVQAKDPSLASIVEASPEGSGPPADTASVSSPFKSTESVASPSKKSKRTAPVKWSGKCKQTDYTKEVVAHKLQGNLFIIQVLNPDGEIAYKADVKTAVLEGKPGVEKLFIMTVASHKAEATAESEEVTVGQKKNIPDKIFIAYYEAGDNENEFIKTILKLFAGFFNKHSKPYKTGGPKPKARAGRILNPEDPRHADEFLFDVDIGFLITELYPTMMTDGTFEDDDSMEEILGEYFSLTPIDEAKEIVEGAFAKKSTDD